MITLTNIDLFGKLIKAVAEKFNLATTNEQEAKKVVNDWPGVAKRLQDYVKIRDEIAKTRLQIGSQKDLWIHYQDEITIQLLNYANELLEACKSFLEGKGEVVPVDEIDTTFFQQDISHLEQVAIEIETTIHRLIAVVNQELKRTNKTYTGITQSQPSLLTSVNIENIFNPGMSIDEIRRWFVLLAENNSKNGKPFLTNEQVDQFIERAFVGNTDIQKLTLNMADGERASITKLFYLFFQRCTSDYAIEPTKHCKEKYVRLLTDNFTNYNYDTVFRNFNNSQKAPKQWNTTV